MPSESSMPYNHKDNFRLAIEAAQICVFEIDIKSGIFRYFENAEAIYKKSGDVIIEDFRRWTGRQGSEYRKKVLEYFVHPDDHAAATDALECALAGQKASSCMRMKTSGDQYIWCKVDIMPTTENGEAVSVIGIISNIDRLMRQSEEYRKKAERDLLTGLLNQKHAEWRITEVFVKDPGRQHALLLMDIDDFKSVNDNFGHRDGDTVLRQTAEHIKSLFRRTDIVGRWGGDEFIILMTDVEDEIRLKQKIEKLLKSGPCGRFITKSIGVAMFPQHGYLFSEIFSKADAALYEAKKNKNKYEIFNDEMSDKISIREAT